MSFAIDTPVATPDGPVAIQDLREGDMVIARDQDTGVSGVFPVTGLMARTSAGILWLTLSNEAGKVSRLGVTSEHPMRAFGGDWVNAGDLVVGDQIEDGSAGAITVLGIQVDTTPQLVHNLEIGGAHTYLAGELEAWSHNAKFNPPNPPNPSKVTVNGVCIISNYPNDHGAAHVHITGGGPSTRATWFGGPVDATDAPTSAKQRKALCDPKAKRLLRNAAKWVKYYKNKN